MFAKIAKIAKNISQGPLFAVIVVFVRIVMIVVTDG